MGAAAEIGGNSVSKHQIQPDMSWENEQAGVERDCWTRPARPNSQARTSSTGKYSFSSFFSWPRAGLATLPGWRKLCAIHTYDSIVFTTRYSTRATSLYLFVSISLASDGPQRARLPIPSMATSPSYRWSRGIFPSLPGSRLTIFYRHASPATSALLTNSGYARLPLDHLGDECIVKVH